MRISDWSSDVCSSDLPPGRPTVFSAPSVGVLLVVQSFWLLVSSRSTREKMWWLPVNWPLKVSKFRFSRSEPKPPGRPSRFGGPLRSDQDGKGLGWGKGCSVVVIFVVAGSIKKKKKQKANRHCEHS